ncbi:MAG: hypothetical protein ACI3T9_01025 [Romboutsia timonensis]
MKKEEVLNKQIQENSILIENIVYDITREYTKELDDIMLTCRTIFRSQDKVTNQELEDLLSQLPCSLYFVNEGQELVGLREDISKMTKMEKYNEARKKAIGTVADKNTAAELEVMNEELNRIIYQRSYKMIKSKVEMGQEMINSLKRVFDARMNDFDISRGVRR